MGPVSSAAAQGVDEKYSKWRLVSPQTAQTLGTRVSLPDLAAPPREAPRMLGRPPRVDEVMAADDISELAEAGE